MREPRRMRGSKATRVRRESLFLRKKALDFSCRFICTVNKLIRHYKIAAHLSTPFALGSIPDVVDYLYQLPQALV
jgi:hypothetical protein